MYFRPFIGATHVPPFILNRPDPQSPAFARDPGRIPHTLHLRNVFGGWDPRHQKPKKNEGFFTPANGGLLISHGGSMYKPWISTIQKGSPQPQLRGFTITMVILTTYKSVLGIILQEFDLPWSRQGRTLSRFRSLNEHVNEKEILVGGFNPSEKYARQLGSFPQGSG